MNIVPTNLVIFGITGDLSGKKIIPSLWHLFTQGHLPEHFSVIGFSRRALSREEFKQIIHDAVSKRGGINIEEKQFRRFFQSFSYQPGTFEDKTAFQSLAKVMAKNSNKLFYLAVPPVNFAAIFQNLAQVKLNIRSRVLIEKPFGSDLATARSLQSLLSSYFKEEQIYRIDHYLFKEIVQGIENFRFSNNLFESIWDNTTIDRIDLRLYEAIGVEERGNFYDSTGAFRDVGQNHLLSLLAAITMEYPLDNLQAGAFRKNRAKILETLAPWTRETIKKNTSRAQYEGYKKIAGVRPDSQTETYFTLKTELTHPKWQGIPIFMKAGKRLAETRKEIILTLKHPAICHLCEIGSHKPNRIIFRLEPNDEIIIDFWTKKPGFEKVLEERSLSFFLYEKQTKVQYVEEYTKVLHAAINGDQSLFVSNEEVEAMWKFTDPIIKAWQKNIVPLVEYKPGATTDTKEIGIIGLGKMGANLARQLLSKGWKVAAFNRTPKEMSTVFSLSELIAKLAKPRTVWLMTSYQAVDGLLEELLPLLEKGDTVIDGGNSPFKESVRRGQELKKKGINFLDVGVSGGPEGARNGACLMIGGERELYEKHEALFRDLSVKDGYGYMGKSGAGHFVKMVHNGIEYGMMQAIAEGFNLLKSSDYKLDLARVVDVYNHGGVIESRLIGWLKNAFKLHGQDLKDISGVVGHTGEGEWTIQTAQEQNLKVKVIEEALKFRIESEKKPSYAGKILSALREQFGGHKT